MNTRTSQKLMQNVDFKKSSKLNTSINDQATCAIFFTLFTLVLLYKDYRIAISVLVAVVTLGVQQHLKLKKVGT